MIKTFNQFINESVNNEEILTDVFSLYNELSQVYIDDKLFTDNLSIIMKILSKEFEISDITHNGSRVSVIGAEVTDLSYDYHILFSEICNDSKNEKTERLHEFKYLTDRSTVYLDKHIFDDITIYEFNSQSWDEYWMFIHEEQFIKMLVKYNKIKLFDNKSITKIKQLLRRYGYDGVANGLDYNI